MEEGNTVVEMLISVELSVLAGDDKGVEYYELWCNR